MLARLRIVDDLGAGPLATVRGSATAAPAPAPLAKRRGQGGQEVKPTANSLHAALTLRVACCQQLKQRFGDHLMREPRLGTPGFPA